MLCCIETVWLRPGKSQSNATDEQHLPFLKLVTFLIRATQTHWGLEYESQTREENMHPTRLYVLSPCGVAEGAKR